MEADIQNQKNTDERAYREFQDYYQNAVNLYEGMENYQNDLEMQLLTQMYEELRQGGWL